MPLLSYVAVFVDGEEEGRDVVVAEPHPGITKDEGWQKVDTLGIVVDVLEFISIHNRPQHNNTIIQWRKSPNKSKLGHAVESDADYDRDCRDEGGEDDLAGAEHRCRQNVEILGVLEVFQKTEPD